MATIDIDLCPLTDDDVESSRQNTRRDAVSPHPVDAFGAGVRVGQLVAVQDGAVPYVVFPGQPGTAAIAARAAVTLSAQDIGCDVALLFADGDVRRPIVIGRLRDDRARAVGDSASAVEIDADGRTFVVNAKKEIVLRCGKASLTLTHAGKVLIRGTYVVSRSSGVNSVKGGTVEIN